MEIDKIHSDFRYAKWSMMSNDLLATSFLTGAACRAARFAHYTVNFYVNGQTGETDVRSRNTCRFCCAATLLTLMIGNLRSGCWRLVDL